MKPFGGRVDQDIEEYLQRFERTAKLSKWTEEDKALQLVLRLEGKALSVCNDLDEEDQENYAKVKEALLDAFAVEDKRESAKTRLKRIRYADYTGYREFISDVATLVKKAHPTKDAEDRDEMVFDIAMERIDRDLSIEMKRFDVTTLAELNKRAPKWEKVLKQNREERGVVLATTEMANLAVVNRPNKDGVNRVNKGVGNNNKFSGGQNQGNGGGFVRNTPRQADIGQARQGMVCGNCFRAGHSSSECRALVPVSPQRALQQPRYDVRPQQFGRRPFNQGGYSGYMPYRNQGGFNRMPVQRGYNSGPPRMGNTPNKSCYNCGASDHLVRNCPRQTNSRPIITSVHSNGSRERDQMRARMVRLEEMVQQSLQDKEHRQQPMQRANVAMQMLPAPVPQAYTPVQGTNLPVQGQVEQGQNNAVMAGQEATPVQVPEKTVEVLPTATIDDCLALIEKMQQEREYLVAKVFGQKDTESPDIDIGAVVTRHLDSGKPEFIPVENRLTIIPMRFNGKRVSGLIDTGATLSMAPACFVDIAGVKVIEKEPEVIQGIGGKDIVLKKSGVAILEIGGFKREVPFEFTDKGLLGVKRPFDILVGGNALWSFPEFSVNLERRTFRIGCGEEAKAISLMTDRERMMKDRKVFVLKEVVIPPETEMMVNAIIDDSVGCPTPTMTIHGACVDALEIVDAIVRVGGNNICSVMVANKSRIGVKLPKRSQLTSARVLLEKEGSLYEYPEITAAMMAAGREAVKWRHTQDPEYVIDYSKCDATPLQVDQLKQLMESFADQVSKNGYDLGEVKVPPMHFETTSETPFKPRIYPVQRGLKEQVHTEIEWMKDAGCVVESKTPWLSPVVMVRKKDGSMRPCIDLRKLNEMIVQDRYPIPRVNEMLDRVGGHAWLSGFDIQKGFWQIPLSEEASRKCGFITDSRIYQCVRMPFGLNNAPAAFMRMMTQVFEGMEESVAWYMDDIIVKTKADDFECHLRDIAAMMSRLRDFDIKVNPKKCELARRKLTFLGHQISSEGMVPDTRNLDKIRGFPIPRNRKECKRFIGLCSFFRSHIKGFAHIAHPITDLFKQEKEFSWGKEQQEAFELLRKQLCQEPVLTFPDWGKGFYLFVDASNVAIGGALMQRVDEGTKGSVARYSAIGYYSRSLTITERRRPTVQNELLAIVEGLRHFNYYLYGSDVTVKTDHRPLVYLLSKKGTHPNLMRWVIELQQYENLHIEYVEGERNTVADALSRAEEICDKLTGEDLEDVITGPFCMDVDGLIRRKKEKELVGVLCRTQLSSRETIAELQRKDNTLSKVIAQLAKGAVEHPDEEINWYLASATLDEKDGTLVSKELERNIGYREL